MSYWSTKIDEDIKRKAEARMVQRKKRDREVEECECKGTGMIAESTHGPSWDRGDGVIYGSSSYSVRVCPKHPHLRPRVYYAEA